MFQAFIQYIELGIETTDAQLQLQLDSKFLEKLKRPTAQFVVESVQSTIGGKSLQYEQPGGGSSYFLWFIFSLSGISVGVKSEKPTNT